MILEKQSVKSATETTIEQLAGESPFVVDAARLGKFAQSLRARLRISAHQIVCEVQVDSTVLLLGRDHTASIALSGQVRELLDMNAMATDQAQSRAAIRRTINAVCRERGQNAEGQISSDQPAAGTTTNQA